MPGSSVHGILQTKILEWVAISFSRGSSQPTDRTRVSHILGRHFTIWAIRESLYIYYGTLIVQSLSHVPLFATLWTLPLQAPLSMEFSRQEHSSGLPFPFPRDLPYLGIEPVCPSWQADSLPWSHQGRPMECCSAIKGMK